METVKSLAIKKVRIDENVLREIIRAYKGGLTPQYAV
jgi:hypothetical protein